MQLQTILFPVDFSPAAMSLAPCVKEIAQRFQANVTILNAFNFTREFSLAPPSGTSPEPEAMPYAPAIRELRKQRQHHLEEFAARHFGDVPHRATMEDGDPAVVIESVAELQHADLIVMPTRGHGTFRRFLLGSITAKVLHDVGCAVLTSVHQPTPALLSGSGFRSIVCAVDLNREADLILKAADFLARNYGAKLCVVHVESNRKPSAELRSETLQQVLKAEDGEIAAGAKLRVLNEDVAEGVRRAALEEKADLVVVGRGHQKENFSRMWSHLYAIIRESPCPVFSV